MNKVRRMKERILSMVLTFVMLVSLFVGTIPEEVKASTDSVYEPLILNSSTLNGSTVWGRDDTEHVMDKDGGFYSSAKSSSGALPDDGKIVTSDGVPYQLAWTGNSPYAGKDSIRFEGRQSGSYVISDSVTMKISTFGIYDKVYVLGTAGGFSNNDKSLNFKVTLAYTDGTTSTTTYSLYDWYKDADVVESYGIGYKVFSRLNKDGVTIDRDYGTNGGPILQSKQIECDEERILKDITFEIADTPSYVANEHGIYAAIYAVTGMVKSGAPARPVASVQNEGSDNFTVSWEAVEGALGYAVDVSNYPTFLDASGEPSFVSGYMNKVQTGTSAVIEGVAVDTTYYCRVRAIGDGMAQSRSSEVVAATTRVVSSEDSETTDSIDYAFDYAYDCQRSPAYPVKGDTVELDTFITPQGASVTNGNWELIDCGKYDSSIHAETKEETLANIVSSVADKYDTSSSEIKVYDLKKDGVHICYGVVCTIFDDGVLFIGTTWDDGAGYYLCNTALSSSDSIMEKAIGDTNNVVPVKPEVTYPLGTIEDLGDDSIAIDENNWCRFNVPEAGDDYIYLTGAMPIQYLGEMSATDYIALLEKGVAKSVVDVPGTLNIENVDYNKQFLNDERSIYITNGNGRAILEDLPVTEESVVFIYKFHKDNLLSATYNSSADNPYLTNLASNINVFAIYGVHAEVVTPTITTEETYNITLDRTNYTDGWVLLLTYDSNGDNVEETDANNGKIVMPENGKVRVFADSEFTVEAEGATVSAMQDAGEEGYYYELTGITSDTTIVVNKVTTPVVTAPIITGQPQDVSVQEGQKATFSITATGENLTYQWQIDRNDGNGFVNLNGATSASYTISTVDMNCNGFKYRCVISNEGGSVTTNTVNLYVEHVHSLIFVSGMAATCTADGNKAYYKCEAKDCDCLFEDAEGNIPTTLADVKIDKLGHDMSEAICTEVSKCQREDCDHTEGKVLGHDWSGEWTIIKEATATEDGKKETFCVRGCGQKKVVIIPATGTTDDNSNLEKDAEVEPGAPIDEATLNNSKAELLEAGNIFIDAEKTQIANGISARVWLEITKTDKSAIASTDKAEVEREATKIMGDNPMITYFDADLFKQLGTNDKTPVPEPGVAIKIAIAIPDELLNSDKTVSREYKIIRLHEGQVDVINGTFDSTTGEFIFESDKFSTYAIVYKDVPVNENQKPDDTDVIQPEDDKKDEVPKTGDSNTTLYLFILMLLSGLGIVICSRKKKILNKES